jgi:hypothetical protein
VTQRVHVISMKRGSGLVTPHNERGPGEPVSQDQLWLPPESLRRTRLLWCEGTDRRPGLIPSAHGPMISPRGWRVCARDTGVGDVLGPFRSRPVSLLVSA